MPSSASLVPHFDVAVQIVLDDFGKAGRVYREIAEPEASLENVIDDLLTGQFNNPVRVVAFNTSEGWSRDVSEDVAREVVKRVVENGRTLAASSRQFVEAYDDADEIARAESGAQSPRLVAAVATAARHIAIDPAGPGPPECACSYRFHLPLNANRDRK
jgi:hypothetical protein